MQEIIHWLSNRDNVTFLIAVLGFGLSLWTAISTAVRARECYDIEIVDYTSPRDDVVQFMVCIRNISSSPLTIISFTFSDTVCELRPKKIRGNPEKFGFQGTPQFPICVPAHGAEYAYIEFVGSDLPIMGLYPGCSVSLYVRSSRGERRFDMKLGEKSFYLHPRR